MQRLENLSKVNLMTRTLLLVLLVISCSSPKHRVGDKQLREKNIPSFLKKFSQGLEDADFFEKWKENGDNFYEVKNKRVSISVSKSGTLIEREEDISEELIPSHIMEAIKSYIHKNYPESKITEMESRVTPSGRFIDVEIRHPSSPSGYWELTFTENKGEFIGKEIEDYETPMTLN